MKKNLLRLSLFTLFGLHASALDMSACIGCHGKAFDKPAMNTSRVVRDLTQKEMLSALMGYKNESTGGAMQSVMNRQMAKFSDKEIEELVENIFTNHIPVDHNHSTTEESNLSTLLEDINIDGCVRCHGEKLEKHAMGVSRIVNQMSKEDIIASINGYRDGTYGGNMKALMAGVAMNLSQEEIEAIGTKFGLK